MSDPIRVNGNLLSWGSLVAKIDGDVIYGWTDLAYGDKRERVFGFGMGRHHGPLGRSAGKYTPEPVKLTGFKHAVAALRERIKLKGGTKSYGNAEFEMVLQAIESDDSPLTIVFTRCVWTGNTSSLSESADPLKEEIEISTMGIRRNDSVLYDDTSDGGNAL
jgi:hypothetical protein